MNSEIRVAIVGVGNCAAALVQGISYYETERPGLISWDIGGYRPSNITFTAGFDVSLDKIGLRLDQAIFAGQNNTVRFAQVPQGEALVYAGPVLDGLGSRYAEKVAFGETCLSAEEVVARLKDTRTQIVINYLPVGSKLATQWWADRALEAGCGFINCIPELVANSIEIASRFRAAELPLIGDDVKSQVGATIVHRTLVGLMRSKGIKVDRTYQLNFGGNMDFYNMLNTERLGTKRTSKTNAVRAEIGDIPARDIHIGPSDFVAWLEDRKWCHIRIEGTGFGGTPINLELKLEVWDSPNSAGVVMDLVRWCRVALDRKIGGVIDPVCSVYMKYPPIQCSEAHADADLARWASVH
jgi:myo-inositol-1-phosphate synthase